MTTETRIFISADDVLALHFECKKCGATVSRKIDECHVIPDLCMNCKQEWMNGAGSALSQTLRTFQNVVRQISEMTKNKEFVLRIQITNETDGPATQSVSQRSKRVP